MANLRTTHTAILLLLTSAVSATACTSILGTFDFEGPPVGQGGGSTTSTNTTGTTGGGGTSSTSGSTSSTTTGSECPASKCTSPSQCLGQIDVCFEHTCDNGCCGTAPLPDGTPLDPSLQTLGDCKKIVCDGAGQQKTIVDQKDVQDDGNQCTTDTCDAAGKILHEPKAGACSIGGKVCGDPAGPAAGKCVDCNGNGDCIAPLVCIMNECVPPGCADGQQNGTESDVDCGGNCNGCSDGEKCGSNNDCISESCVAGHCAAASCSDNVQNAAALGETDIDCGGPACNPCPTGKKCLSNGDCIGNKCMGMVCVPSCTDGVKNGGESDIDCGAACGQNGLCAFQKACNNHADCATGFCNPALGSCDTEILAGNQGGGLQIAVDGTNVYWVTYGDGTTNGTVMKMALGGGGTPFPLVTGEPGPNGIAIDAPWPGNSTYVYWTAGGGSGTIKRKRVDNTGTVDTIASNQNLPGAGIAVNATHVIWANDGDGAVRKATLTTPFTLSSVATLGMQYDQRLAIDGAWIYWTRPAAATIQKFGINGGATAINVTSGTPGFNKYMGIAVDAVSIYWVDNAAGLVQRVPVNGGSVSNVGINLNSPTEIAIDANNVYVLESTAIANGRLLALPTAGGGGPKVLATGLASPRGIAVDGTHVYFGAGFALRRVHK